ncbi:uncharacterized protein LOC129591242 [Paramacrobiotus metropolitanus]|uniref:uncharacterized protein LOC129591242 n=1 Tax=Paramacrobiotus metropolitanus TaxID=2943436 RepID=UPI002446578F|nr:uncharacterized protein LOC129591242 [Paramacrobiotus metropolitanus]
MDHANGTEESAADDMNVIAPSDALFCPDPVSVDNGKKPYLVYSQHNEQIFKEIADVLTKQSILGLATVFDATSAKVQLRNLSYFVISTVSPAMTYVFDCNNVVADDLFLDLRNILQNQSVLKIVHPFDPTVGFLIHRQHMDMNNIFDLQVCDKILRSLGETPELASLTELICLYVDPQFVDKQPVEKGNVGLDSKAVERGAMELQAAMQGAFLIDIYRNQQQVIISPVVQHLDAKVKAELAVFGKKPHPESAKA